MDFNVLSVILQFIPKDIAKTVINKIYTAAALPLCCSTTQRKTWPVFNQLYYRYVL